MTGNRRMLAVTAEFLTSTGGWYASLRGSAHCLTGSIHCVTPASRVHKLRSSFHTHEIGASDHLNTVAVMSDSEDDMPLLARAPKAAPKAVSPSDSEDDKPLLARSNPVLAAPRGKPISDGDSSESSSDSSDSDSDFEDDVPLSERKKKVTPAKKPLKASEATKRKRQNGGTEKQPAKRQKTQKGSSTRPRSNAANGTVSSEIKWTTLVHSGVLFPPEYEPHGIKMLYDGKPVDLTPAEEEVATMYAVMKETDYVKKDIFNKNFWGDFKEVLGKNHVIQSLSKCDFTPIYEWHMAEREKKKAMTKEVTQGAYTLCSTVFGAYSGSAPASTCACTL